MKRKPWIGLAGAAALLAIGAAGLLGEYDAPRIGRGRSISCRRPRCT